MEKVFAVPTAKLQGIIPQGLHKGNEAELLQMMAREGAFYDRTPELETNLELKQIIPYIVVTHADNFLIYQRTPKQTETRLHRFYSIGFGGHINPEDAENGQNPIIGGRTRELREELILPTEPSFTFMGTLNVCFNPIELFHLGLVYIANVNTPEFTLGEPDKFTSCRWVSPHELSSLYPQLEGFSKGVFEGLFPQLVPAKV